MERLHENATCHIAFGAGFDSVIKGFESLSKEEIHNRGVNDSIIHVDFMVGSSSLNIDGIVFVNIKMEKIIFRIPEFAKISIAS